ncbi:hypothetical protein EA462_10090 [Natrarchaeobius halalkaliphilus]|uniref:Uncharacterized protein n=1 Tax=Natrarchaeobius halalkaliphilus TaxID=1679091 RepID=A0A3N6M9T2_9EURY|nr:hypothetical protein [Natrarchaeobius halalkaliphilus]RQG90316.1 hypothetical protein EA462_10090 [Natrarchaeobius halalkaliphilus]
MLGRLQLSPSGILRSFVEWFVDRLGRSLGIVPQLARVGYAYEVEAFSNEEVVLERRTFEDGMEPSCSLEFVDEVSTSVSGVRKEVRRGW